MRNLEEPDIPPQINIVPMIDVIFAILTFFIMASLFLTQSEGLPVNLPKATTAEAQNKSKIAVTIDDQGEIFLNDASIAIDDLSAAVTTLMGNAESALVVINADESVEHGQVIAVMDELRAVEGATIGIATQRR